MKEKTKVHKANAEQNENRDVIQAVYDIDNQEKDRLTVRVYFATCRIFLFLTTYYVGRNVGRSNANDATTALEKVDSYDPSRTKRDHIRHGNNHKTNKPLLLRTSRTNFFADGLYTVQ